MNRQERPFLEEARAVLESEGRAVAALAAQIDSSFVDALALILDCQGHVLVSGGGTSGTVARRAAHLLSCAGAPALYLDAGLSFHGSAAAVTADDRLLAFSKGGETDELNQLVRVARLRGAKVIAVTANPQSTLGRSSDVVLCITTPDELDPQNAIGIGSTLAAAALADALCFAVLSVRGFDRGFFSQIHPGGAVGKRLAGGAEKPV